MQFRVQHFWCQLVSALFIRKQQGDTEIVPDDLIVEILSRLPAEDVLKCRRVCRKWRALTSSPQFIEKHLNYACPILFSQYSRGHLKFYFLDEKLKQKNVMSKRISTKYMPKSSRKGILVDSCDGLLLFDGPVLELFICNPVMQQVVTLRKPYTKGFVIGIFLHSSTKEYRLIYSRCVASNQNEFLIASIGSKYRGWRRLGTTYGHKWFCTPPLAINNCLYWTVSVLPPYSHEPCRETILEFNIDSEEFKALPHPGKVCSPTGRCMVHKFFSKMERDDAALCFDYDDKILVWVLKDHGKWSSWEIMYQLNAWALKKDLHMYNCPFKYGNIQNKELLLVSVNKGLLIRYNLETKSIRKIRIKKYNDVFYFLNYTKSLVSLKDLFAAYIRGDQGRG